MTATEPADPTDENRDADEDRNADGTDVNEDRNTDGTDVDEREVDDAHLQDVEPGAGCTEIWEHLSETRDE